MQITRRNILSLPLAGLLPSLPTPRAYRSILTIDDDLAAAIARWEIEATRREFGRNWPETFAESGSTRQIGFCPTVTLHYSVGKRGAVRRTWREFHDQHDRDIIASGWSDCRRCWMIFTKGVILAVEPAIDRA